ncbi:ABC transporter ATP-binding protein [Candidatus Micrarchaeota archaeon]|nr:ABC transporter ATP-binding protein [Candidatus Micrarchaeota archaeon]
MLNREDDKLDTIEVKDLEVSYSGGKKSISNCSFSISSSEIFGLLGFNGAGKSTIIKVLSGVIKNFSGEVKITGENIKINPEKSHSSIAYVPQFHSMFDDFTVKENILFFCKMEGVDYGEIEKTTNALLEEFQLKRFENIKAGMLSGGYRQLLNIAISMILDKPIVIFDEPTAGLDLWAKRRVIDYIKNLKHKGKTVILTTHDLQDAEQLCDNVIIISDGIVMASSSMRNLIQNLGGDYLINVSLEKQINIKNLKLEFSKLVSSTQDQVVVSTTSKNIAFAIKELMSSIEDAGLSITDFKVKEPTLSDVFSNIAFKVQGK